MFKLFVFALFGLLALAAAEPKAKPGVLAYSSPLLPSGAAVYSANYAAPYLASPYLASPYVASPYVASPYIASPYAAGYTTFLTR